MSSGCQALICHSGSYLSTSAALWRKPDPLDKSGSFSHHQCPHHPLAPLRHPLFSPSSPPQSPTLTSPTQHPHELSHPTFKCSNGAIFLPTSRLPTNKGLRLPRGHAPSAIRLSYLRLSKRLSIVQTVVIEQLDCLACEEAAAESDWNEGGRRRKGEVKPGAYRLCSQLSCPCQLGWGFV